MRFVKLEPRKGPLLNYEDAAWIFFGPVVLVRPSWWLTE